MKKIFFYGILIVTLLSVYTVFVGLFFQVRFNPATSELQPIYPEPVIEIPAWERKVSLEGETLKVGLITDTHLDSKRYNRNGNPLNVYIPDKYQKILDDFVADMTLFDPAFIVHLGDVIEGSGVETDIGEFEIGLIKTELEKVNKPVYWAIGNHDLRSVARRQFVRATGKDYVNGVIDQGPYRFIILDANYRATGVPINPIAGDYVPGYVPKETMAWLEEQLKTDQHVYVFAHHSFVEHGLTLKNPVLNYQSVQDLLSKYHVKAVFDGHIEKRFFREIKGVQYYAFPGIKKSPDYPGAYYAMTLVNGEPQIVMYYQDPITQLIISEPFIKDGVMIDQIIQEQARLANEQADQVVVEGEDSDDVNAYSDDDLPGTYEDALVPVTANDYDVADEDEEEEVE